MKKLLILSLALLFLLAGCDRNGPGILSPTTATDPAVETTLIRPPEPTEYVEPTYETVEGETVPTEPEPVITTQYLPETVENPDDLPVLKWLCAIDPVYGGRTRTWTEDAVKELNKLLEQKEMPFRVQFILITSDGYSAYREDWYQKPEVQAVLHEADLVFAYMTQEQMQERLTAITQYVEEGGRLAGSVPHALYWTATTVDGEVYGIPCSLQNAVSTGWRIKKEQWSALGLSEADFKQNFWEMDDVFAQIYAQNGNKPFLNVWRDETVVTPRFLEDNAAVAVPYNLSAYLQGKHLVGSCFAVDYSGDLPQVVNVLEQEDVRAYQEALIRYKKAGYTTSDSGDSFISYGVLRSDKVHESMADNRMCIPVTAPVFQAKAADYVSGIAVNAAHKEEAVKLLELIATDEAFRMQLFFGQEGRDYAVKNGYYTRLKGQDGSCYNMDFLSPLAHFCGLTQDYNVASLASPATDNAVYPGETGQEKLASVREHLDNSQVFLPIVFDFWGYKKNLEKLTWNLDRYYPYFTNHTHFAGSKFAPPRPEMTPALYDLMLEDLMTAGSEDVKDELQYQLDKWLEKNPQ